MSDLVTTARDFAFEAHEGQTYGTQPYSVHLQAVADILKPYGDAAQALGYLHDVLEDTDRTYDELEEYFGPFVAKAVSLLSDEPGKNRKTRKKLTHRKLEKIKHVPNAPAGSFSLVLVVKAADRLANLRASAEGSPGLLEMYRKEHPAFTQAAYRPGLCDELWEEMRRIFQGEDYDET